MGQVGNFSFRVELYNFFLVFFCNLSTQAEQMFWSTLLASLVATVSAMHCEWSASRATTSCCHAVLCGCSPLPEASHTPGAGVSDECTYAPVHLVMHRHKDQERSRLRASFNAAVLWGEIGCTGGWFTQSTQKGLGFFCHAFFSFSL